MVQIVRIVQLVEPTDRSNMSNLCHLELLGGWVVNFVKKKYTLSDTSNSLSNAGRKGSKKLRKRESSLVTTGTSSKRLKLAEILESDQVGQFSSFTLILHDSLIKLLQTIY